MADVNVRSDAVDVEQIMRQIRSRIREKRGVDYTEAELQQLAKVKLEKFLDPRGVHSDLLEQFRAQRSTSANVSNYEFGEETLYETHRGPLRALRRLLLPILKLFFNPDKLTSALHIQADVNTHLIGLGQRLEQREALMYELVHNLTVEITRLGIEMQGLKMRVESLSSRMDFDERRARSLESVVQYRAPARPAPRAPESAPVQATAPAPPPPSPSTSSPGHPPRPDQPMSSGTEGAGVEPRRRRRRRRRRRPGQNMSDAQHGGHPRADGAASPGLADAQADMSDDGSDDGGPEDDPEGPDSSER
jgi:hypothetical protein